MNNATVSSFLVAVALAVLLFFPFAARAEVLDPATYQALESQIKLIAEQVQKLVLEVAEFLRNRQAEAPAGAASSAVAPYSSADLFSGPPAGLLAPGAGLPLDSGSATSESQGASALPGLPTYSPLDLFSGPPSYLFTPDFKGSLESP